VGSRGTEGPCAEDIGRTESLKGRQKRRPAAPNPDNCCRRGSQNLQRKDRPPSEHREQSGDLLNQDQL